MSFAPRVDQEESERQKVELQQEMLDFAREMKQSALHFGSVLNTDHEVLSKIAVHQYKYLREVKEQGKVIDKIQVKTDWFATLKSMLAAMISLVLFFVMLGFIRLIPSKSYVYLPIQ